MGFESLGEWIKDTIDNFADYIKIWVRVNDYQEAVILRWGKYHRTLSPGFHFKWFIFEYHMLLNVKPDTMDIEAITITTLDGKTISPGLMIHYEIVDSRKHLLNNNDSPTNMKSIAKGEMSDLLEDINWADTKKKTTKNALRRALIPKFEDMGVNILDMKFTDKCETRAFRLFSKQEKNELML
jgi:regulator of protease activity HflC (stomatin/prohibitin superfamily)